MADRTLTIDCQVHAYERNKPERPWVGFLTGPDEVTGDDMIAAMDAVGVDGALLISPFVLYAYDASYALEVYAQHPTKFGADPGRLIPTQRRLTPMWRNGRPRRAWWAHASCWRTRTTRRTTRG